MIFDEVGVFSSSHSQSLLQWPPKGIAHPTMAARATRLREMAQEDSGGSLRLATKAQLRSSKPPAPTAFVQRGAMRISRSKPKLATLRQHHQRAEVTDATTTAPPPRT